MDIADLLVPQPADLLHSERNYQSSPSLSSTVSDDELMAFWLGNLSSRGFQLNPPAGSSSKLTDAMLDVVSSSNNSYIRETPIHIKVIGRHMNGSYRCHIGMGKASRPIRSVELSQHMRLIAVFFRPERIKNNLVAPTFILFPTWLLHLFRYTQHNGTPGRTDVRFLDNEMLAKEDHIYRLNHVINKLFRFNLHAIDKDKLCAAIELTNYLFDVAGLAQTCLPRPDSTNRKQPDLYVLLMNLLNSPRPPKSKPVCHNCNTKPASRRKLCVACYRYQLKHGEPRPLRLIVASRHSCHVSAQLQPPLLPPSSSVPSLTPLLPSNSANSSMATVVTGQSGDHGNNGTHPHKGWYGHHGYNGVNQPLTKVHKVCANCGIQHTHQWYRNLCGSGHWCETCKSYYLRHSRVRPPQLFVKAAKRKVNVRALVNWSSFSPPSPSAESDKSSLPELTTSPIDSPVSSSGQATPVQAYATTTTVATAATSSAVSSSETLSSSSSNNFFVYYHQRHDPHYLIASSSKDMESHHFLSCQTRSAPPI